MTTGYVWDSLFAWHDTGTFAGSRSAAPLAGVQPGLPYEHPDTKRRFHELVEVSGLLKHLRRLEPQPVSHEQVAAVHDENYLAWLESASALGGVTLDGSTHVGKDSFAIAQLSAGATLAAVNAVLSGEVLNAYALSRPPGHHATRETGMGFCLLNNIGVAVTDARRRGAVDRVAVIDFDVHHGNGTQSVFYGDPAVLTVSLHQDRNYPPDSGHLYENGEGAGAGANINVPLPPGSGHGAYVETFHRVVLPALRRFRPDLIVVASGFDASAHDPLGRQMLTSASYREMTHLLMMAADELCAGRIVFSHEGGYNPNTVPFCGLAVIETLSGIETGVTDPYVAGDVRMGQQELQPHQAALITGAAELVSRVPVPCD